jgi:hypothetical protein
MDNVQQQPEPSLTMTQDQVAEGLLWPLWRCIEDAYKDRYKREIWDHFENAIRSAAYTAKLSTFLTNFKNRIHTNLEAQYMKHIRRVTDCGHDAEVLNWLRDETTYLVMITRLMNQERRDQFNEQND